ncbi:thiol reductant ABC exporter subunit CydC [Micrococcus sp.]|uniref:thiol reductant ABC exporter subunit CydC n=1 Tax=Micrococcus sp. TaxID=1271 RepID=UPI0039C5E470
MDIPGSGITGPAGLSLPPLTVLAASHDPALHRAADQLVDENGRGLAPAAADRPIDVRLGAGPRPSATAAESDVTAADAGPDTATDVALATDADAEPAAPYPGLRAALRVLPWGERRLWFGVAWATATHLSAALLAALSGWLIVTASGQPPILYLLAVIVLVRAFGLSRAVCRYADRLATHDAVLRWADRLRLDLWDALARRPALWGRLSRADGALSVLIADVDALRDAAPRVIVPAPAAVAAWLFTAGAVVVLAPELAVATLVPGLLGLVLIPALSALLDRRDTHRTLRHRAALLDRVGVVLGAAADLHGLGRSEAAVARLADADAALQRPQRRTAWVAGLGRGLAVVFSGAAALAAAGTATQTGTSAPLAAFVVFLALSWAEPFGALAQSAQQTGALVSQARAAAALLGPQPVGTTPSSTRPAPRAVDPAHPATGPAPVRVDGLRLRGAGFSHAGAPAPLWEHLDLDVRRGATAVVTGPSGAGKSTLLAVLLGFLPLDEGRYTLLHRTSSGLTATPADEAGLARVAWTPQDALVFDSTVRGNLALARDRADAPDDAELTAVLELVGLGPWLADAPQGLDTPVGPGGHTLSGGQRQRLAVARALVARADVVLLDEPTAHVGQDEALTLMADLRRALAGHTTVVVTHDTRLAAGADVHLALG